MRTVVSNREAGGKIARRETFRNSSASFSGDPVIPGGWPNPLRYLGYLPKGFHESLSRADYVVYSYSTPIGWHVPGEGWHVPEVTYSTTTSSRHQPVLRSAVWADIVTPSSWSVTGGSPTAAEILRNIRAGYTVSAKGRTRRIKDILVATGEVILAGDNFEPIVKGA